MKDSESCPHQDVRSTAPLLHFHAVAHYSGLSALRAVTFNHRNVGVGEMRQLAAGSDTSIALHHALSAAGVESFVLTTCNRTELYWRARVPGDNEEVDRTLGHIRGALVGSTRLSGRATAVHLFRVCAGLESLVLGEAEILGQVRASLEACTGAGPFLEGVVRAALRAGRMARAETAIGVGAQSVASAAVRVLADSLTLADGRVLVVGAGDTGRQAARHLHALGVGRLLIANRTPERAEALAAEFDGTALSLDRLAGELTLADAIVCAVSAPAPLVDSDLLARTAAARRGRRLIVVDISMPPAVARVDLPGIERVDLDALARRVARQHDRRAAQIPRVEAVIDRELSHLDAWVRHHTLRPFASDLRRKIEAIRRAELARVERELTDGRTASVDMIDRLTRRLVEQVLAVPLATLAAGQVPLDLVQADYLRRLFALGPETQP
jgi:glutamyl-tRNA reductase